MSKHLYVRLTDEQRSHLDSLIHSGTRPARVQTRARILLACDLNQGKKRPDAEIASALRCARMTVGNIRRRFATEGLQAALEEKPRPGATPKITGEVEAQLIALACSPPPAGKRAWTLQMLADKLVELKLLESISDVAVMHRLKQTPYGRGR